MQLLSNTKTLLASLVLSTVAVFGVANAAVSDFTDAAEIPSWADEAIEELMDQGVIAGNDDGSFAPNRQLNRAEVSKIIVLATGIDMDTTGGPHFPDVASDAWYYDYIETMYNQNWINGYPDGMFRPGVGINRAEIAKMVVNAFEVDQDLSGAPHFGDVSDSDWFYTFVETAYNNGCMRGYGDGTFGPGNAVTRAETAKIVYDCQLVVLDSFGGLTAGTLEVVLSAQTPRGTNIPFNATSVPFTTVEFTASDDADVEIGSVAFTRLGLGDNDDFDNVWMEIDGFKVGNDKSVNNDDMVELRFNPPIVVPAGQTIVADLVASMEVGSTSNDDDRANTGHHNRFAIVSAADVVSSAANTVGDFPVEGEEMEIADYEVSQIGFSRLGADSTVNVGDSFVEIGKFRLLNESNTNKDVEMRAITFKNDGTAELEDVLENVALYVSGEQVSAETIMDGDYVTFRLDDGVRGGYVLEDGDSKIFSIRADVVSAEDGDVINFKVDNFEDIVGVEIGTAFGVKAISGDSLGLALDTGAGTTSTNTATCTDEAAEDACARLRAYNVDAGDLNISRDPSSLGNQEYAPGSNDVVFMTARLVADQPIIVDGVTIDLADSEGIADLAVLNNYFDNFRLYLNDKLVDSENDFTGTDLTDAELSFNTTFEIAGTSVLKLVGNVEDAAETGSSVKLSLNSTGDAFDSPEYISTGDQVTSDEIVGSALASFVEVEESVITITRTDGRTSGDKIVAGVDDVTFLEFVLDNNDSGDVNITSVSIQAAGTGAGATYQNYTAAIFVDGVQQGSARNLESDGTVTFNDLSVVVPSASQKPFEVVVDTLESSANTVLADTETVNGAGTVPGTPVAACAVGTVTIDNSMSPIPCAGGLLVALSDGDTVVLDAGGADDNVIIVGDHAVGATSIAVNPSTVDVDHAGVDMDLLTFDYPATVGAGGTITLASIANISVGDALTLASTGGPDECEVMAISGTTITIDNCSTTVDGVTDAADAGTNLSGVLPVGADVDESTSNDSIAFFVTDVSADNIENGQDSDVLVSRTGTAGTNGINDDGLAVLGEGTLTGTELDTASAGTITGDGDCNDVTTTNTDAYLCGVSFSLVSSGTLTVTHEGAIDNDSNIVVAGDTDVEVYEIRLSAANDDIEISDLYLVNQGSATAGRATFKLFDEAGTLLGTENLVGKNLHFQLGNSSRIRVPKDGTTTVTVAVDANSITQGNQTGATIELEFDLTATGSDNGVEAVTAATGSDLAATSITNAINTGEEYILYRTMLTFANLAAPTYAPGTVNAGIYRFSVTNDVAYEAILNQMSVELAIAGDVTLGAGDLNLVRFSSAAYSGSGTIIATATAAVGTQVFTGFEENIDGTTYYELQDVVGYADAGTTEESYISSSILEDAASVTPNAAVGTHAGENIVWSDRSANGGAGFYMNGFELIVPDGVQLQE